MSNVETRRPELAFINPARDQLLASINAAWTTQAIATAVRLRIPERLEDEPQAIDALAQSTGCHAPSLLRLLRALVTLGVVSQAEDGRFALSGQGALLLPGAAGSLAAWAEFCGTFAWTTWGQLADCVRSGQSVRMREHGVEGFAHLEQNRESAQLFNRAMVDLTSSIAATLVRTVDFRGTERVVDVGGGFGGLLAAVLNAWPGLRGVLFDLAHATDAAGAHLEAAGLAARSEVVTGSFFDAVPTGADVYLLKSVLHDWDDEQCAKIVAQCARAMGPQARLLVVERMMPGQLTMNPYDRGIARSDLQMLAGPGGRERTQAQYEALLSGAGLGATRVLALSDGFSVLDCARLC